MSDVGFDEDWVAGFVELQLRDLRGESLTQEERRFIAAVGLAEQGLPGALAEALLELGLGAQSPGAGLARVAAADLPDESEVYRAVQESIREGQTFYHLEVEGRPLPVLEIFGAEEMVTPCYCEGYTTVVERRSFERQVVGRYGGIFIALSDLKRMNLDYDEGSRTIRLYEE
jgi:hypothetical protein